MFCKNCSSELENGARFCNNCGAPVETPYVEQPVVQAAPAPAQENTQNPAAPYTPPAYAQPVVPQGTAPQYGSSVPYNPNGNMQPPVQPKKSNKGCLIAVIIAVVAVVVLIAGVIILGVIGYNAAKDIIDDTSFTDSYDVSVDEESDVYAVTDLTYEEIFSSNNIIEAPAFFTTKESCAMAYAETDGYVEKSEYGYEDDVIMEMVDTYYFPLDGYEDEQADAYATLMKGEFISEESLDFCTVTYNTTNSYFIVTVKYTDVDDVDNLKEMQDVGLLDEGDIDYLSMEETERNYLDGGFVKK